MTNATAYARTNDLGGATPRETEALAFGFCNVRLAKARSLQERLAALHKTHLLWSILVRDLGHVTNRLPVSLRNELVALGVWAMGYSLAAMTNGASLQPLIDVNQNLAEGLRAGITITPASTKRTLAPISA